MAENLVGQGIDVTIVEATPQVLPPLDPELAILVADELVAHGVHVETGATVASVEDSTVTLADGRVLPADLVVGAIGVRPDVRLAESGRSGARTERRDRRQRGEPDERSRHLRGRRRGREGRRDLACDVAHRPRQRRQPPGSTGGRPHRRTAVAPGRVPRAPRSSRCSTWSRRPSGGANGACGRRVGRSERSIRTRSTTPPTTRARRGWPRS